MDQRNETTKERVCKIIADKSDHPIEDVTETAHLRDDLGFDSLDTVELAMELEDSFGIKLPDTELEKIATVGDAITTITSKMDEQRAKGGQA